MPLTADQRQGLTYRVQQHENVLKDLHDSLDVIHKEIAATQNNRNKLLAKLAADPQVDAPPTESIDLISFLHTIDPPPTVISHASSIFSSAHTKVPTHVEFLPTNTDRFITSGKDGMIKLWQLDPVRTSATNVLSINGLRNDLYPLDISVNPFKENLVAVYGVSEEIGSSQMVVVGLSDGLDEAHRVHTVAAKTHHGGILHVKFMPWKNGGQPIMVTSGDDPYHRLFCWKLHHQWVVNKCHQEHTSRIGGFCGLLGAHVVVSVGRDKKVVAFDADNGGLVSATWRMRYAGLSVIANPLDFNLVCVQTNEHKRQLRLVDLRISEPVHGFGWSQENTTKQSSFVSAEWSPNGWLVSSGSSEKFVHVFDIRFNREDNPTNSFPVHSRRVCKAAWHPYRDALLSVSSDLTIGYLKLSGERISSI